MCIFSQPVISVNNTQIFARTSSRNTQFLAYQMSYESADTNAMILPLPVRRPKQKGSLRFIDLSHYEDFFDDLADGFPYIAPSFQIGCSLPMNHTGFDLEVFEVGNYIASFVPTLSEFSRLDQRFNLPDATWSKIPQYTDFGFAVFQLAKGSLKPHPMAFEFEIEIAPIYFPTLHIHDGKIHETEEFDHVLYLQHAGFDSRVYGYQNSNVVDKSTNLVRSKYVANQFCDVDASSGIVDGDLLVHRRIIRGNHDNRDTEISTSGDPEIPTLNLRPWFSYTPWIVFVGAVSWFFARRHRIRRQKLAEQNPANTDAS
jgi:hypothetical protein